MFCDKGHKCRPVEGATLSMTCSHCTQAIAALRTAVTCSSCAFCLCSRCCQKPNFSPAELRAKHPASGCGDDCQRSHGDDGPCMVCGRGFCICHAFVCAPCAARHVLLQAGARIMATLARRALGALGFLPENDNVAALHLPRTRSVDLYSYVNQLIALIGILSPLRCARLTVADDDVDEVRLRARAHESCVKMCDDS